jgi:hypothetical protein
MKTLKFLAIFCLSALAFVGCQPDNNGGNDGSKGLLLVADKTTIYDNGTADIYVKAQKRDAIRFSGDLE